MSSLKAQWRYQFTAERWSRFVFSRLWLGLPIVAISTFALIVVIGLVGGLERDFLLERSFKEAVIVSIGYAAGLLIATCRTPEEIREEYEREMQEAKEEVTKMSRWKAIVGIICCVAFLVFIYIIPDFVAVKRGVERINIVIDMVGDALCGLTIVAMQIVAKLKK